MSEVDNIYYCPKYDECIHITDTEIVTDSVKVETIELTYDNWTVWDDEYTVCNIAIAEDYILVGTLKEHSLSWLCDKIELLKV
jgi:hypothetical protein